MDPDDVALFEALHDPAAQTDAQERIAAAEAAATSATGLPVRWCCASRRRSTTSLCQPSRVCPTSTAMRVRSMTSIHQRG